jgi:hypothetical protein
VHLADSANFKGITPNKLCSGLTGSCFESPNDTIHVTVVFHAKKDSATNKRPIINANAHLAHLQAQTHKPILQLAKEPN